MRGKVIFSDCVVDHRGNKDEILRQYCVGRCLGGCGPLIIDSRTDNAEWNTSKQSDCVEKQSLEAPASSCGG